MAEDQLYCTLVVDSQQSEQQVIGNSCARPASCFCDMGIVPGLQPAMSGAQPALSEWARSFS